MIEINILKKRWEKYRKKFLIVKIVIYYFAGLILIFFLCSVIFFSNKFIINGIKKEIKTLENKIAAEKNLIENIKEINAKLQTLCKKCSLYEDEYKNRLLWSKNLAVISESVPSGMWISKLSYQRAFSESEKNITIIVEGFISPYYIKPEKGCLIFINNLKANGKNLFDKVLLSEITKGLKEDNEVYYFKFEIKVKNERITNFY